MNIIRYRYILALILVSCVYNNTWSTREEALKLITLLNKREIEQARELLRNYDDPISKESLLDQHEDLKKECINLYFKAIKQQDVELIPIFAIALNTNKLFILQYAVRKGNHKPVQEVLKIPGINVNKKNRCLLLPTYYALRLEKKDASEKIKNMLLNNGALIDMVRNEEWDKRLSEKANESLKNEKISIK